MFCKNFYFLILRLLKHPWIQKWIKVLDIFVYVKHLISIDIKTETVFTKRTFKNVRIDRHNFFMLSLKFKLNWTPAKWKICQHGDLQLPCILHLIF